jgi:uncharacterized membrane protein
MQPLSATLEKHRLAALQDGVYAIAMTLLVLELKLPPLPERLTDALLWSALLGIWPKLLTWLLSFWVLAVFWIGDARALTVFKVVDPFLLRLSLWRLALVSLIPFSTAFIGEHGNHSVGAAVYSAHLFLLAAAQVMRNAFAQAHPDAVEWPGPEARVDAVVQSWVTFGCTAVAFGLSFLSPGFNMLALLPLLFVRLARKLWSARGSGNAA